MREVAFIQQNKERWLEFEQHLYFNAPVSADYLAELFIQLNNDLAYAQTYYPKSKVVIYLNALAVNAYHKINNPRQGFYGIINFWAKNAPLIIYKNRKYIYFAQVFFIVFVLIGIISSLNDDSFVRAVLSDDYVDETYENIRSGDPAAIYNNETLFGDFGSFMGITINNIKVGLLMYISGFSLGIGTIKILFSNAVMVGTFQTMFYQAGQLWQSMSAIWIHGAMEIYGMTIEAGAGLLLGLGWLFPGTLKRKQAFIMSGKESLIIVLSTIPFTIFAGLLEGFVTQYYNEMPLPITMTIIVGTLLLITYYYWYYPIKVFRNNASNLDKTFMEYAQE